MRLQDTLMSMKLSREALQRLVQSKDISKVDFEVLTDHFRTEPNVKDFLPDGYCETDPRNGDRVVFNSARARRPHDNHPAESATKPSQPTSRCIICEGKTTQIVDVAELSEGFTFINKNLYPIFFPDKVEIGSAPGAPVEGFHFLQWTSSLHEKDWHNMPQADRLIVFQRLAALEQKMLSGPFKYVSIIKNYGRLVGGSLAHGHQQIAVSNILPNRIKQDVDFQKKHAEPFSSFLLRNSSPDLIIKDYGAAILLTPYFMRRPYDMMLIFKDATKERLHQMNESEMKAVVDGWQDAIRIMLQVMPRIGKETAYNVVTHSGAGVGIYFEFLPFTQEMGGFEQLGLYLCQGNPKDCAANARGLLHEVSPQRNKQNQEYHCEN